MLILHFLVVIFNGDWGLGPIPNPQSPIPNPQSPINKKSIITKFFSIINELII